MRLRTDFATMCGRCGHTFHGGIDPYTCPACGAGPPHTASYNPYFDRAGGIIAPDVADRLTRLGVIPADELKGRYVPFPNGFPEEKGQE